MFQILITEIREAKPADNATELPGITQPGESIERVKQTLDHVDVGAIMRMLNPPPKKQRAPRKPRTT